ncbi:unnamed protein product [Caenorhabditis sp. 36 PRJEB53466]|nr:unnamed protein product [Caenorhabditis sp. 36 PRJEB53466]
MKLLLLAVCVIAVANAVEVVPRASALRTKGDVRRAPLPSISSFAPLAKSLRPASTGIRRAPETVRVSVRKAYRPANPAPRAPMTLPVLPNLLQPLPLPQFIPIPVPVISPQDLPTLGTLPTLAPHTFPTFTPIPGLPTMPGLTMPPSFQRLLGITTTTMKPAEKSTENREETESESESESGARAHSAPTFTKDLNTIRSRLSKFSIRHIMTTNNNSFHVKGKEDISFERKNVVVACDVANGKITYVDVSSQLMGVLFAGDEILNVNGEGNIKTTADFIRAISSKCPGKVSIEFMRDDHCLVEEKVLPPRRPNTQMFELSLTYRGGAATGIIIHRMTSDPKTITISMVQSASNACRHVKDGDVLVKVNDIYVLDRDAARKLLYASVNNTKAVRLTLERSTTTDPLGPAPPPPEGAATTALPTGIKKPTGGSLMLPPPKPPTGKANKQFDVLLPQDVLEIMKNNKDFYKKMCKNGPCIVKTTAQSMEAATPPAAPVPTSLPTDPAPEVRIPYNPSPKPLKATPKRVGS